MDHHHLSHGVKSRIPQAPWVLHFDGASRKPAGHGGLGVVLRNSKGQVVEEEKRFLGAGVSSGLAKYKALVAGLKKAQGLHVKHLLAKGNSRILINQVIGRWTARDALLREQLKKVWAIAKDFDSLFMEFIPKEHNLHADRIANAAVDKELQIQEVVSTYFDRSSPAWQLQAPQHDEDAPPDVGTKISPPAARLLTAFSNSPPALRPISPLREKPHQQEPTALRKSSGRNVTISHPRLSTPAPLFCGADALASDIDSELPRPFEPSNATKSDKFWADRLSISDEASSSSSSTGSEDERSNCFKTSSRAEENLFTSIMGAGSRGGSCEHDNNNNNKDDEDDDDDDDDGVGEEVVDRCRAVGVKQSRGVEGPAVAVALGPIQLSEADCERLVETVIERLKRTVSDAGQSIILSHTQRFTSR